MLRHNFQKIDWSDISSPILSPGARVGKEMSNGQVCTSLIINSISENFINFIAISHFKTYFKIKFIKSLFFVKNYPANSIPLLGTLQRLGVTTVTWFKAYAAIILFINQLELTQELTGWECGNYFFFHPYMQSQSKVQLTAPRPVRRTQPA